MILRLDFKEITITANGTINYDGINSGISNQSTTTQINFTIDLAAPTISNNESNITFFWNYILNNQSFITINYTQLIRRLRLTKCTAATDIRTLNISIFNEELTTEYLEASVDVVFNVWTNNSNNLVNFTFNFDGETNYSICLIPNTSINVNAQIFYNTTGGFDQKWFLSAARLTTNTSLLNLYNFKSTTGIDQLGGVLRDSNFNFFPNVITELQRYYPSTDTWRYVQMDKSGETGNVLFNIIEGTQDYRLNFIKKGSLIDNTNPIKFFCDTNNICDVTFSIDDSSIRTATAFSFQFAYNNNTQMIQLNFTDTTGLTNGARLIVTNQRPTTTVTICDTTVSASSGIINCNTSGYAGILNVELFRSASPLVVWWSRVIEKITLRLFDLDGIGRNEAGLWATGISTTFILGGTMVGGGLGGIIAYIFSIFVIFMLQIQNFVTISFITLVVVIATVMAILLRRGRP